MGQEAEWCAEGEQCVDADSPQSAITSLKSEQDVCRLSSDKRNYHWLVQKKDDVFNES